MGHYIKIYGTNCGDFCDPYIEHEDHLEYNSVKRVQACRQCRFAFNTQYRASEGTQNWGCETKLISPGSNLRPCALRTIYEVASEVAWECEYLYRPRVTSWVTTHADGSETNDIAPTTPWGRRVRALWHLRKVMKRVRKDNLPVRVEMHQMDGQVQAGVFIDLDRWHDFWNVLRDARHHIAVPANEDKFIQENAPAWELSNLKRLRAAMLVALANDAEVLL
jgi:hypothetical protein